MVHKDQINIVNEQVKFSVSWILCNVANLVFNNHGTIIRFQVWCSNKTNIFLRSINYTSETYK